MNKIIRLISLCIIGAVLGIGVGTLIAPLFYKVGNSRDIHKLDMKFGTPPSHPEYHPIVHLATHEGKPFCTAFVIDSHYAATAGHCIVDDESVLQAPKVKTETFKFLNDQNVDLNVEVKAVGYDEWTDYGLLLRRL